MKKVTLKDIAKELNVTVGTVSHALNGLPDISKETKNKVFQTAKRMGYIGNGPATALRLGKTNTIAVIVPDISNPHIAYQIKLIEEKMREKKYSVIILNTNEDEEVEFSAIRTACSRQVDGIFICPCQQSKENIEFLQRTEAPFVLIGRYFEEIKTDYVCADDIKGGYLAARYLIEKGYKEIVYIGTYPYIECSQNRFTGIKNAYSEAGLAFGEGKYVQIDPKGENIDEIMKEIDKLKFYDSVIAFSDIIAFKIMSKLKDENVPVVGFDGIASRLGLPYSMPSVGMEGNGWANKAVDILINKINGKKEIVQEIIDVKICQ